ncbi:MULTISPECIES: histone deacetylase family protein [unclassified Pseudomonas]|uniref:histone deacetylase family protein n=1 Tax=unclassified Pseudomonas TaxID=196821 RepID=UPI0015A47825|nr:MULTISPECIES: histone deacetylase family protein [unclassified Pseudomonas]NWC94925.1 histone deacetylase family protein [Pseudomonas sp. IPO3779]NWD15997.1 histone deacetylase family protein [Pseudomonas sp. IPO3778]
MLTVFSDAHRLHHGTELKDGVLKPSFEQPSRADTVRDRVKQVGLGDIIVPRTFDRACYVNAHSERYVSFLETAWAEWTAIGRAHDALPLVWPVRDLANDQVPQFIDGKLGFFAMDAGSPITSTTWEAVKTSADIALTGLALIDEGHNSAFALCRPPGHHAAREYMGGYCYLNNAAIAAQQAITRGARRVAVLDVDFHHGNGTQNIFYNRSDVMFVSLHGDPSVSYPYYSGFSAERGAEAGEGFNLNYPLAKNTGWSTYKEALLDACNQLRRFSPEVLVISLGVDTFKDDPISHFLLDSRDFLGIGEIIASVGVPTLFVMEGGYMVDEIGINAVNVLQGFENKRS